MFLELLSEYGLFLAKAVTWVMAFLICLAGLLALMAKQRDTGHDDGSIVLTNMSEEMDDITELFLEETLDDDAFKQHKKIKKNSEKAEKKADKKKHKDIKKSEEIVPEGRLFVIEFEGDVEASDVSNLRECVNAVLMTATAKDEVLVIVESHGGYVHSYGLAASQLVRFREKGIKLTVAVDAIAASGGYLMAVVANDIIAAPFAIVGSIGVIAEMPNFNKVLKKYDVDYESHTAGKYKRTLTVMGENTDEGRSKFKQELSDVHRLFKQHISEYREVDVDQVSTGEHWHAVDAVALNLVDRILTSDEYIQDYHSENKGKVYKVEFIIKERLADKLEHLTNRFGQFVSNRLFKLNRQPVS